MEQNIFRLHSADLGSDFDTKNMEIGTLLNVSFVDKTTYLFVLKLFQSRKTVNSRIVAPSLRRLAQCYKLNTTHVSEQYFFPLGS